MSDKKRVMIVFGTRPEAIKMAPLVRAIEKRADEFALTVCVTGQHRQMLDQVMRVFDIIPDLDLDVMSHGQDLSDVTTSILLAMKGVLQKYSPDIVVVHGDTTTAFAASLAAFYQGISVAHVEAGLRTHKINSPFPEEFNRQVISKISKLHFAPTELSKKNLLDERLSNDTILVTGNTVIDALFTTLSRIEEMPEKKSVVNELVSQYLPPDWQKRRIILITGHRRENFGNAFLQICEGIKELAKIFPDEYFIYPLHLNPNVQKPVTKILSNLSNVFLIPPLDYEPFVYLLKHCHFVLTDSGGIQEEAPSLGKPVLLMRDDTERPEAVDAGTVKLVGANKLAIIRSATELLNNEVAYQAMAKSHNPYGDGFASERIVEALKGFI